MEIHEILSWFGCGWKDGCLLRAHLCKRWCRVQILLGCPRRENGRTESDKLEHCDHFSGHCE